MATCGETNGGAGGESLVGRAVSALSAAIGAFRRPADPVDPIAARLEKLQAEREEILSRPNYSPQTGKLHPEYEQLIRDGKECWPHAGKDYGPLIQIRASCFSCAYYRYEEVRRSVTDEADTVTRTSSCRHPSIGGRELRGSDNTPTWCPYFAEYLGLHVGRLAPAAN
ncbi:hypothetical protein GOB57_07730 [Sinorhizobium meliloti]|nr:hypothetical protein [Sinorhizobium meliloti]